MPEIVSEQNRFPRLGNYPHEATKKELVKYVNDLLDWCQGVEEQFCNSERPQRKVMCQLPKGHEGSHQAVVYWEGE